MSAIAKTSPTRPNCASLLAPLRQWIENIRVENPRLAHLVCQWIPCRCPFERDIALFGRVVHIPALCRINPVYEEIIGLRYRALCYLADTCGEDITPYVCQ